MPPQPLLDLRVEPAFNVVRGLRHVRSNGERERFRYGSEKECRRSPQVLVGIPPSRRSLGLLGEEGTELHPPSVERIAPLPGLVLGCHRGEPPREHAERPSSGRLRTLGDPDECLTDDMRLAALVERIREPELHGRTQSFLVVGNHRPRLAASVPECAVPPLGVLARTELPCGLRPLDRAEHERHAVPARERVDDEDVVLDVEQGWHGRVLPPVAESPREMLPRDPLPLRDASELVESCHPRREEPRVGADAVVGALAYPHHLALPAAEPLRPGLRAPVKHGGPAAHGTAFF